VSEEASTALDAAAAAAPAVDPADARPLAARIYKSALFGGILGGLFGTAYGIVESFGTKEGRRPEKLGTAMKAMRWHTATFAGVFAGYQAVKEGMRYSRGSKRSDPFDPTNAMWATVLTVLPMAIHPVLRKTLPHVMFLVVIDSVNEAGIKMF
jgi:hypothetical protein